jgi:hypothetical protein
MTTDPWLYVADRPTLAEVRTYIGVPATALSDADLQRIYGMADDSQRLRCNGVIASADTGELIITAPLALNQAFLRRIQREVAARNLPLGMVGLDAAEYGPQRLPFLDALVEETERPYRKQVLA